MGRRNGYRRYRKGWRQVAFARQIDGELHAVDLGDLRLMLVCQEGMLSAFNARCPHFGADLTRGGKLDGEAVICPFHGRRIGLNCAGDDGFVLSSYQTLVVGGLVFVLIARELDYGLANFLSELEKTHYFVPGFTLMGSVNPEYVIENGLDPRHFAQVHGLAEPPALKPLYCASGALAAGGTFKTLRANKWQSNATEAEYYQFEYEIRVFSPFVCVSQIVDGGLRYVIITTATPNSDGQSLIRVSIALPGHSPSAPPDQGIVRSLLRDCKTSIEQDLQIWSHLPSEPYGRLAPGDELIGAYREFCQNFQ